jgi:hypothetical protein
VHRWALIVNNNKPGEFVSSSGNFFDLASYSFGRGCDHRAGCAHARVCDAGLADTLALEETLLFWHVPERDAKQRENTKSVRMSPALQNAEGECLIVGPTGSP